MKIVSIRNAQHLTKHDLDHTLRMLFPFAIVDDIEIHYVISIHYDVTDYVWGAFKWAEDSSPLPLGNLVTSARTSDSEWPLKNLEVILGLVALE